MEKFDATHLNYIIEAIDNGIITISKDYKIDFFNKKALNFLGENSNISGKNILDFIPKLTKSLENLKTAKKDSFITYLNGINLNCDLKKLYDLDKTEIGFILILNEISTVNRFASSDAVYNFDNIIGESEALKSIIKIAKEVSASPSTILITGESGCGKELLAQSIHNSSLRENNPFIAINCGALPKSLIETELFGYEEGTFTGAKKGGKPGKFELANGGTIFLDEIGEMPLEMQVHLLRVLQEGTVTRVGGKTPINVDVRVIAATNKNLKEEIKNGRFREDLYYRLNVIPLHVPPLKDRFGDVPILLDYFLKDKSKKLHKPIPNISSKLFKKMISYCWPGNIRELENCVENIVNLNGETSYEMNFNECTCLKYDNLGNPIDHNNCEDEHCKICNDAPIQSNNEEFQLSTLLDLEISAIKKAIHTFDGNMTKASESLGISRNALYNKMKRYGIQNKRK